MKTLFTAEHAETAAGGRFWVFLCVLCVLSGESAAQVSFNKDVFPILRDNCMACHSSAAKMGGLILESYESLMKGGAHGPPVAAGNSAGSRMVQMLEGKVQPQMPMGMQLKAGLVASIAKWIDAGAPGPKPGEAAPAAAVGLPEIKPRAPVAAPVSSLAFSPDGKILAAGRYQEVELLDAATGRRVATLAGHADAVRALAFSRDGKWLAAAGGRPARSGEVIVWDAATRQRVSRIEGHADSIYAAAFSRDGSRLATSSYDKLIKLWDVASGRETATLQDHIDSVYALEFSPDGARLASGAADRSIKMWDPSSGLRLFTLSEPLEGVLTLAFHPSGKQIAAAGFDKFIRTWDLTEKGGTMVHAMAGHEDAIVKIAYSPDGKRLVSSSADRSIRVWDAATLEEQRELAQPDWALALAFSPDGKRLAAGRYDGSLALYDATTFQEVASAR